MWAIASLRAFETRLYLAEKDNHYLSPLPLTGQTAKEIETWINQGVEKDFNYQLELIFRNNDKGQEVLVASGYEFERSQCSFVEEKKIEWIERVLVIKSPRHAEQQIKGLEKRLQTALNKIKALTPERGRGKRQITTQKQLKKAIEKILTEQQVANLLSIEFEKQTEPKIRYVGRGRGSQNRPKQVIKKIRYSIVRV